MNFRDFDDLIHSGANEIVLDSDIILSDDEESEYLDGIRLDVDNLIIDGNNHSIDACGKARIFLIVAKSILTVYGYNSVIKAFNKYSILTLVNIFEIHSQHHSKENHCYGGEKPEFLFHYEDPFLFDSER